MIVLDVLCISLGLWVCFVSRQFVVRVFAALLLCHYGAALLSEFGGGNLQLQNRLLAFLFLFAGTIFVLIFIFSQVERDKENSD